jgi:AcrR family transcriptional regulator
MARSYDMRRRTRDADATRNSIVRAAHGLLDQPEGTQLTLQEVAAAAGVSRATIYNRVGSRTALLTAVFEDTGRRIQYERVRRAARIEPPARALVGTVRESCRAWARGALAIRRTLALAVLDPEIGSVVRRFEGYRRAELAALVRRAARAGALGAGVPVTFATATFTLLSGFAAFDHLQMEYGAAFATTQLVRIAETSLGLRKE